MQANTYKEVGLWEEYEQEKFNTHLNNPKVREIKVRKMTQSEREAKNKAIVKRRAANKKARKSRRT